MFSLFTCGNSVTRRELLTAGGLTRDAGYVTDDPVTPADLTATILRHLGVNHIQRYEDEFQRLHHRLSDGEPIRDLK